MQKHPLGILLGATVALMPMLASAAVGLPKTVKVDKGVVETVCISNEPEWRKAQTIEGVKIQESLRCSPDNPAQIAAEVKGTNNISMETLITLIMLQMRLLKRMIWMVMEIQTLSLLN
jgi:hypothetical protein